MTTSTSGHERNEIRVFISYRRTDCQAQANGLHDGLRNRLPGANVFMDIDSIPYGVDFEQHIRDEIKKCHVVLVLIGDNWLDPGEGTSGRRVDEPDDFVRLEIENALALPSVRVVPVLLEGATMPRQGQLPDSIRRLGRLNAIELSDRRWMADLRTLADLVDRLGTEVVTRQGTRRSGPTPPPVSTGAQFPSRITDRYVQQGVSGMGRDQLLALIAELVRRRWSDERIYEYALSGSPLKPPRQLPGRVTVAWLANNVPLLSPTRLDRLIKELRKRNWSADEIREHVLANRQQGLATPLPTNIQTVWVRRYAPLMTADEQDQLAAALVGRGWSLSEIHEYMPFARPPHRRVRKSEPSASGRALGAEAAPSR